LFGAFTATASAAGAGGEERAYRTSTPQDVAIMLG
jgi:hypothetical protein